MIIKPQLEQWSKLSSNPLHIPVKTKNVMAVDDVGTGASVLCGGKSILRRMGVKEKQLVHTTTIIRVVTDTCQDSGKSLFQISRIAPTHGTEWHPTKPRQIPVREQDS